MAFWICIGSVFNGLLDPFRTRIQWPPQALLDPFRIRIQWASRSVLDPYSMTFWICLDPYSMAFWIRFGPVFSGLLDLYWIRIQWPSGSVSDPYSVASWIRFQWPSGSGAFFNWNILVYISKRSFCHKTKEFKVQYLCVKYEILPELFTFLRLV